MYLSFSKTIIRWFCKNKRDLPWRHTKDPYKIWLSEIILQQTRVQQGLPYYEKFISIFPTIRHLAKAKKDVVMKAWAGLGYYSRARNLHQTAKYICKNLNGKFPTEYDGLIRLKGIGVYTAGAIASFAFNKPHPVVDGNVFRVLARYFGIKTPIDSTGGQKEFLKKATLLLDKKDPGLFNQAIMEFGAIQCVPQNPDCGKCPLRQTCKAFKKDEISTFPVKSSLKGAIRTRYFNYFIIRKNGKMLIKKRTENDIWKNLYDFPMIETTKEIQRFPIPHHFIISRHGKGKGTLEYNPNENHAEPAWLLKKMCNQRNNGKGITCSVSLKHILSHQIIYARFWEIIRYSPSKSGLMNEIILPNSRKSQISMYIPDNQINKLAFPRLIERYFEEKEQKIKKNNL